MTTATAGSVQAVRCLYCGKAHTWWTCDCVRAQEAQQGKRPKPRVVERDGKMIIVLDEEAAAANGAALPRYARPKPPKSRGLDKGPAVNVEAIPSVSGDAVNKEAPTVNKAASDADRKVYMRDYMRARRVKPEPSE